MKNMIKRGIKFITDSDYRFRYLAAKGYYNEMPDRQYLERIFKAVMGYPLNLDNPQSFNEKLQWLKLYGRKPEYTMMVDKYKVREYIAEQLGGRYLIPLLGVWDDPDEIDFNKLPEQFVLKCNHNSGLGMCICKEKSKLDIKKVKNELRKGLKENYYLTGREWPYKDVPRKIICEEYMIDSEMADILDYKFMCFNGEVRCILVCSDRFSKDGMKLTFFDKNWSILPFKRNCPKSDKPIEKPETYDKMITFSEKLSARIPFIRIDFYEVNKKLYFGELTFFPGSGMEKFSPESADRELGSWLKLPKKIGDK